MYIYLKNWNVVVTLVVNINNVIINILKSAQLDHHLRRFRFEHDITKMIIFVGQTKSFIIRLTHE